MQCPKCGGQNVNVQVVNEVKLKKKHHGVLYWLCFGWLLSALMWIFFTIPVIIVKIFGGSKKKAVNKQKTVAVCQDCGNKWNV